LTWFDSQHVLFWFSALSSIFLRQLLVAIYAVRYPAISGGVSCAERIDKVARNKHEFGHEMNFFVAIKALIGKKFISRYRREAEPPNMVCFVGTFIFLWFSAPQTRSTTKWLGTSRL
jgi:hypothetical protein